MHSRRPEAQHKILDTICYTSFSFSDRVFTACVAMSC